VLEPSSGPITNVLRRRIRRTIRVIATKMYLFSPRKRNIEMETRARGVAKRMISPRPISARVFADKTP
jgi:hypothetical protein